MARQKVTARRLRESPPRSDAQHGAGGKRPRETVDLSCEGAEGAEVVEVEAVQEPPRHVPRVKQTARRSTGGNPPRKTLAETAAAAVRPGQGKPTEGRTRPAPDCQDDDNLRFLHQGAPVEEVVEEVEPPRRGGGRVKQTARRSTGGERAAGYRGFGSFHSDNVEVLIRRPAVPLLDAVALPAAVAAALDRGLAGLTQLRFGREARAHFLVDFDNWTFLNHGVCEPRPQVALSLAWGTGEGFDAACGVLRMREEGEADQCAVWHTLPLCSSSRFATAVGESRPR